MSDLDFLAIITGYERSWDGVRIVHARCVVCGQDVTHGGGRWDKEPNLGARTPHCRCPFGDYILIEPDERHPIPKLASPDDLKGNTPKTDEEIAAVRWYDCPHCHVPSGELCTGSRWRTCPARITRLLRGALNASALA